MEKEELLKRITVRSLPELEAKLLQAAESLDAGKGVDGEKVFARLCKQKRFLGLPSPNSSHKAG
ncbi:MAG TPA: hypothetical protein VFC44_18895 [Candidatus Saccharimonadales bacterium]|nr:hypothetical protein [Candidatus Saccharimonadales bacterium]